MADDTRHRPDGLALAGGLLAMAVSVYIMADGFPGLRIESILAIAAVGMGIVMLIASVRTRRDR